VKRQNGSNILPTQIDQIERAWVAVNNLFGIKYAEASLQGLKISHTGDRLCFASKAAGMYIPKMKTIAVSAKIMAKSNFSKYWHTKPHIGLTTPRPIAK
jgi:hypothetical protein